ncbi:hypothetical protein CYMTET_10202 [Cymbomonas tetramitiformis]|uniref:SMP-LTD domain-containing protein n=1 Tax=Cymbomonas tetramitiformis TaxID=36881 RepID=A0AAE0LE29_9CHLO|nr:hypothetical protein CYMTET_10202 [Cymbomonas tetramitiformis]
MSMDLAKFLSVQTLLAAPLYIGGLIVFVKLWSWTYYILTLLIGIFIGARFASAARWLALTLTKDCQWLRLLGHHESDESPNWIRELLGEIPSWVTSPRVESATWMNKVLEKVWTPLSATLCGQLRDWIEHNGTDLLKGAPYAVVGLQLEKANLGIGPPTITGVKYLPSAAKDEVLLEVGLAWASDPMFLLQVETTKGRLSLRLQHLRMHGTLQVLLRPLLQHPPLFGTAAITFKAPPKLTFDTYILPSGPMPISFPVVARWLRGLVRSTIASRMVAPKFLEIPLHRVWEHVDVRTGVRQQVSREYIESHFPIYLKATDPLPDSQVAFELAGSEDMSDEEEGEGAVFELTSSGQIREASGGLSRSSPRTATTAEFHRSAQPQLRSSDTSPSQSSDMRSADGVRHGGHRRPADTSKCAATFRRAI